MGLEGPLPDLTDIGGHQAFEGVSRPKHLPEKHSVRFALANPRERASGGYCVLGRTDRSAGKPNRFRAASIRQQEGRHTGPCQFGLGAGADQFGDIADRCCLGLDPHALGSRRPVRPC
jgi:hypothetical protein